MKKYLALVAIASLFAAGCTNSSDQSGNFSLNPNCTYSFSHLAQPYLARGSSPLKAVGAFLLHGSVLVADPKVNPVEFGFPALGWHLQTLTASQAEFTSHGDHLDVSRISGHQWEVEAGAKCSR